MRAIAVATAFVLATLAAAATSQNANVVTVIGSSTCPDIESINGLLHGLSTTASVDQARVEVVDHGESYDVKVNDVTKHYSDAKRDCAARERVVAAYVAVVMTASSQQAPADAPMPSASPSASASASEVAAVASSSNHSTAIGIDLLGDVAVAPGIGATWGGSFALRALHLPFGATLGCEYMAPLQLGVASYHVAVMRVPCFAGVSYRIDWADKVVASDIDLGFAAGLVNVRGLDFPTNYSSNGFEWGARAALATRLNKYALSPVAEFALTYYPRNFVISVDNTSATAATPNVWITISFGAAFQSFF